MALSNSIPRALGPAFAAALMLCGAVLPAASAAGEPVAAPAEVATPDWRATLQSFARDNFRHPAWGYGHCLRDYELAKSLAQQDGVELDDDVLFATAMMHDIAAMPQWAKEGQDHADTAVEILPPMLRNAGFPEAKIPAVLEAVRTHFFDRVPVGPEAIYIHDADALDWLGAIGAFRLSAIVESGGGQPTAQAAMGLLQQRLVAVPPTIISPAGKKELGPREQSLKRFLDELGAQSDGFKAL